MLILSRKIGEVICINDDIRIVLLAVKGNQTRIGIDAPKDTAVNREEIYRRIQGQKAGLADDSEKEK